MIRIKENECGTEIIDHNGNLLGPMVIIINHSNNNNEYILIGEKDNIGNNYWYISLLNPEYIEIIGNKMTQEEKNEFITIISDKWNEILNKFNSGCNDLCGDDKNTCDHYCKRNIIQIPDYTLLD